jgi:luciferase family oxidoreductase group 1
LGSSLWSAAAAAQLGLNYAFAHFIAPQPTEEALAYYRERFTPSTRLPAPNAIVALGVICADTTAEAEQLMLTRRAMYRRIRRGDRRPIPTPAEALEELGPGPYPDDLEGGRWPLTIWGDPPAVKAQLDQITTALAIDEIMAITVVHDPAARRRSYELLAEMYGIRG